MSCVIVPFFLEFTRKTERKNTCCASPKVNIIINLDKINSKYFQIFFDTLTFTFLNDYDSNVHNNKIMCPLR